MSLPSQDLYLVHRADIEAALDQTCRRNRLGQAEADEFRARARLALIENEHARLRAFSGRSSLKTFLVVVVNRLLYDWRRAEWGGWEPSKEAQSQGALAIRLERLTHRDRFTLDEAFEILQTNFGVSLTRAAAEEIYGRLPPRTRRTFVGDEVLEFRQSPEPNAEVALARLEANLAGRAVSRQLESAVTSLTPEDQLIVKMRFDDGLSVANIARTLDTEQKALYKRIARILQVLRRSLEGAGVDATAIAAVMEFSALGDGKFLDGPRPLVEGGSQVRKETAS